MSFAKKVVIVTGSSSGIGAATAILFAKEGADVTLVGRNETKLKNVAEQIEKFGRKPLVVKADLAKDDETKSIVDKTIETFGKLDVLVNNAALVTLGCALDGKMLESFDGLVPTNLRAPIFLTQLCAPYLATTKGNIINVSSVGSTCVSKIPNYVAYSICKAALDHFTRFMALELAPTGVRVNCVKPGPVTTDIFENAGLDKSRVNALMAEFAAVSPLKKVASSEELADLIIFLASDKAKSITGSIYVCDNGYMLTN